MPRFRLAVRLVTVCHEDSLRKEKLFKKNFWFHSPVVLVQQMKMKDKCGKDARKKSPNSCMNVAKGKGKHKEG